MSDATGQVIFELRSRQRRAIAVGDGAQDLWDRLAQLADLHRPTDSALPGSELICHECSDGKRGRSWPCQTFRVLSSSLSVRRIV